MATSPEFEAFTFSPDDPLAEEHAAILACIEEAVAAIGESEQLEAVDLKLLPSGQRLLKAKPDRACGYFFAASAQAKHLNREFERFEKRHEKHPERWSPVWNMRARPGVDDPGPAGPGGVGPRPLVGGAGGLQEDPGGRVACDQGRQRGGLRTFRIEHD